MLDTFIDFANYVGTLRFVIIIITFYGLSALMKILPAKLSVKSDKLSQILSKQIF